jgi:hypothetical protein
VFESQSYWVNSLKSVGVYLDGIEICFLILIPV